MERDTLTGIQVKTTLPRIEEIKQRLIKSYKRHMRQAHNQITKEGVSILRDTIRNSGTSATRNLANSTSSKYIEGRYSNAERFTTEIGFKGYAEEYAYYANYGRRPGLMPPTQRIEEWLRAKISIGSYSGDIPKNEKQYRSFAYIIARSIGEKGTKGSYFMEAAQQRINALRNRAIEEAHERFVEENR